ncbi:hypothetical protein [Burkholderia pseudomallei]|uniref:hypothetical protein n=1 Tax=Burkholderia pseudomallei TaxID=28450 RepID=UPI001E586D62|nr:hypothetical protein [Burkholderia pseudomallei]
MNKTLTEVQINRRWVEILIETLSLEKPTTIGPNDASCFVNALRGILAAQQPEPRAEVTNDDKVCAERYRWLRERAWYVDAATYALELRERWRNGDEPPPDTDDVECALDAARTQGSQS